MPSIISATTTNGIAVTGDNSGALALQTNNGTTAVTIDTSQNVGIGTSSPTSKLAILENTNGNSILNVRNTNSGSSATSILALGNDGALNGAYLVLNSSANTSGGAGNSLNITNGFNAPMTFATNNAERMRIDSSGNVGIGTSSPSSYYATQLVVNGGADGGMTVVNTTTGDARLMFADGTAGDARYAGQIVYNHGNNYMMFGTNGGTERMRITSGGRLNIGTTGGSATRLEIEGGETVCAFINTSATDANYKTTMAFTDSGGTTRGTIRVNNSATQYNTSSDYRLKENIAPMSGALAKVQSLKPCTYTWKIDGHSGQGFIAHELAEIFPDAVAGEKDAVDEEGKPVYQGVDTSFLVATLTAAIQELKAELDATKAEVQLLKNPPVEGTE